MKILFNINSVGFERECSSLPAGISGRCADMICAGGDTEAQLGAFIDSVLGEGALCMLSRGRSYDIFDLIGLAAYICGRIDFGKAHGCSS